MVWIFFVCIFSGFGIPTDILNTMFKPFCLLIVSLLCLCTTPTMSSPRSFKIECYLEKTCQTKLRWILVWFHLFLVCLFVSRVWNAWGIKSAFAEFPGLLIEMVCAHVGREPPPHCLGVHIRGFSSKINLGNLTIEECIVQFAEGFNCLSPSVFCVC